MNCCTAAGHLVSKHACTLQTVQHSTAQHTIAQHVTAERSTSSQRLGSPQLVPSRNVLQEVGGRGHCMRSPLHPLCLPVAHLNHATAQLQNILQMTISWRIHSELQCTVQHKQVQNYASLPQQGAADVLFSNVQFCILLRILLSQHLPSSLLPFVCTSIHD